MHSITISPNNIVQKPLQFQKRASGIPNTYNVKDNVSNKILVMSPIVKIRCINADDPMEFSKRVPIFGNIKQVINKVMMLFPTTKKSLNKILYII